jgi:hypothetical protein
MPPKAHLKHNPIRRYQLRLAERLGKTLAELERDIGTGELAEWIASDEMEDERKSHAQQAQEASQALYRR